MTEGLEELVEEMKAHFVQARRLRDGVLRYPQAREDLLMLAAQKAARIAVLAGEICGPRERLPAPDLNRQHAAGGQ